MKQDRVLIIDDDVELCRLLSERLQPEGFTIEAIYDIWDLPQRLLCAIMGSAFHQKICNFFLSLFIASELTATDKQAEQVSDLQSPNAPSACMAAKFMPQTPRRMA
jgi:CheY-like chemotaxis protein